MSNTQTSNEHATRIPGAGMVDMKLEVVVIPVSDVDRAKRFYGSLGWRLDADFAFDNGFRVVQFTPPGSACSIQFGTKITSAAPGSVQGLYLIVSDIEAARDELVGPGADVSEVFHPETPGAQFQPDGTSGRVSGPAPDTPATARSPRSAIRTATAGCSRRSRRDFPDEGSAAGRRDADRFCERQRSAMASTKRPLRSTTGRSGTPPTSSRASAAGLPRRRPGCRAPHGG